MKIANVNLKRIGKTTYFSLGYSIFCGYKKYYQLNGIKPSLVHGYNIILWQ